MADTTATRRSSRNRRGGAGRRKGEAGNALTRKIGPLPAWGWLLILTGVLYYMRSRTASSGGSASSSTGSSTPVDTTGANALGEYQSGYQQGLSDSGSYGGGGGGYGGSGSGGGMDPTALGTAIGDAIANSGITSTGGGSVGSDVGYIPAGPQPIGPARTVKPKGGTGARPPKTGRTRRTARSSATNHRASAMRKRTPTRKAPHRKTSSGGPAHSAGLVGHTAAHRSRPQTTHKPTVRRRTR